MFSDDQRGIFLYRVNSKEIKADPDRIQRRFFKALAGEDLDGLMTKVMGPGAEAYEALDEFGKKTVDYLSFEATEQLIEAIYFAFDQKPVHKGGEWTEREAMKAYRDWCEFMGVLKKRGENSETPSTSLEPATPSDPAA